MVRRIRRAMKLISRHGLEGGISLMTQNELAAARFAVAEAVRVALADDLPRFVEIDGTRFPLRYSNAGRVFVCNSQGKRLLASDYGVLWPRGLNGQ